MKNKMILSLFTIICFCFPVNAEESTMEFNGSKTTHNGITVSFSTGAFTNSSDGSEMDLYNNHPWATPLNGGDDYMDISISSSSYIFNITVAWGVNVQRLILQFLNMDSIVSEISNFNAGGNIVTPTVFEVNATVDVIRFLDAGSSRSGGFELSHITFDLTLPVELTSFSATTFGKDVKLSWNTATEINNYGFEVERFVIKDEWEKIGFLNGNGNSNSPKDYSFVDDKVSACKYSYRLKQIDNDGQFEYSKTIEIDLNGTKKFELSQNYPNPFNPTTTIKFEISGQARNDNVLVTLKVYDVLGNEVATLMNEEKQPGNYGVEFNASGITTGIYIYRLTASNYSVAKKLVLLK